MRQSPDDGEAYEGEALTDGRRVAMERVVEQVRELLPYLPTPNDPDSFTGEDRATMQIPWRISFDAAMAMDAVIDAVNTLDALPAVTEE